MSAAEVAAIATGLGLVLTVIGALWRVGSVGRTLGETMARVEARLGTLEARVGTLEAAESVRVRETMADLRRRLERAERRGHPEPDPPPP